MRTALRVLPAVAAASAALTACNAAESSGGTADECPSPTTAAVRADAARSAAVLRVTVVAQSLLTDGVTTGRGLVVRVDQALTGTAAAERVAVWPGVDTPTEGDLIGNGTTLVVFARPHERPTTADGTSLPAYDISATNGLLAPVPEGIVRVCKGGRSVPADAAVLDVL
ncbi:hypothetical protein [Micromonospora sp. HM5-17]|uniref:hypothetical protein n=1 Tax=Micromonospora sp. HM5-17 TaxID=2487710 RepID=UPI000F464D89|nr:hypothetical protein [Micromonospora sp. HM5-17]ROT32486.1 hypothetical protein EF879_13265 [Micromonospora sp. HM5-17]